MEIDRRDGMTDEQISDGCRDPSNRMPGCLSCDVLHTLEFLNDVTEEYKNASND